MKKPVLVGVLLFAVLIALIAYSSLGTAAKRVEVCMQFDGRTACRTAAGATKDFAERTATSNACAQISSGVTDTINCEHAEPVRVTWK
jgi:hypothetical protein